MQIRYKHSKELGNTKHGEKTYFKLSPVISHIRKSCLLLEEDFFSVGKGKLIETERKRNAIICLDQRLT